MPTPNLGLDQAGHLLDQWIERENYKGWDPYDALNSPLLGSLVQNRKIPAIILVQIFKNNPINLRRIFGISKTYNAKAMGLFLATYLRKHMMNKEDLSAGKVMYFSDWLVKNVSDGYHGTCWGYPFDWPNRDFFAAAGTPTIVNTAFVGLSFIDLTNFESGINLSVNPLDVAKSACEFILNDLSRDQPEKDEICFSYTPNDHRWIHNANLMGARLLAETSIKSGNTSMARIAFQAANYTVRRQRPEGWWPYGESAKERWIDNFHTGFVLTALKKIGELLDEPSFIIASHRGYYYWKKNFFLSDGTPKYYPDRIFPIDTHSISQAILTFLAFADIDPQAHQLSDRTANWAIRHMQDQTGYFYYRKYRMMINKTPYMRWSSAWMQRALTEMELSKWRE